MMKNHILLLLMALIVLAAAGYFFVSRWNVPVLRTAKQCERSGDLQQAHALYAAALFELTPSIEMPDINRSKILAPEILKKEVEKYFDWINAPAEKAGEEYLAALDGMTRCGEGNQYDNTLSKPKCTPLSSEEYLDEWNRTFFAPNVTPDSSHVALATINYHQKRSLLIISSTKSYTYEINLINKATHRGTRAVLLAENSTRLYAAPGNYLLLCRSSVTFPSEKIWRSAFTPVAVTVPDTVSLITAELRTSVHRRTP